MPDFGLIDLAASNAVGRQSPSLFNGVEKQVYIVCVDSFTCHSVKASSRRSANGRCVVQVPMFFPGRRWGGEGRGGGGQLVGFIRKPSQWRSESQQSLEFLAGKISNEKGVMILIRQGVTDMFVGVRTILVMAMATVTAPRCNFSLTMIAFHIFNKT